MAAVEGILFQKGRGLLGGGNSSNSKTSDPSSSISLINYKIMHEKEVLYMSFGKILQKMTILRKIRGDFCSNLLIYPYKGVAS